MNDCVFQLVYRLLNTDQKVSVLFSMVISNISENKIGRKSKKKTMKELEKTKVNANWCCQFSPVQSTAAASSVLFS